MRKTSLFCLLSLGIIALFLSGCGRKGDPEPPPGCPSTYPKTYPTY